MRGGFDMSDQTHSLVRVEGRTLTADICKQVAQENILGCNIMVEETPYCDFRNMKPPLILL
jgi:hypothetical protein